MKNIARLFGKTILYCLISILAGFLLMTLVYLIPSGPIFEHVRSYRGNIRNLVAPILIDSYQVSKLDTHSESFMLSEAAISGKEVGLPAYKAALMNHFYSNDEEPRDALMMVLTKKVVPQYESYSRYWHGYLLTLKPLLYVFNFQQIQWMNMFVLILLTLLLCWQFSKKGLDLYIFPLAVILFWMQAPLIILNLQFTTILFILLIQLNLMLLFEDSLEKGDRWYVFFLFSGIIAVFFDFLTYPLVTLGIPLTLWVLRHRNRSPKEIIGEVIRFSIGWFFGYAVMWVGKWILTYFIADPNAFEKVAEQSSARLGISNDLGKVSPFKIFSDLFAEPKATAPFYLLIATALFLLYLILRKKAKISREKLLRLIPFLIIALYPLIWVTVMRGHTLKHLWFVYRILSVTFFALLSGIASLLGDD